MASFDLRDPYRERDVCTDEQFYLDIQREIDNNLMHEATRYQYNSYQVGVALTNSPKYDEKYYVVILVHEDTIVIELYEDQYHDADERYRVRRINSEEEHFLKSTVHDLPDLKFYELLWKIDSIMFSENPYKK